MNFGFEEEEEVLTNEKQKLARFLKATKHIFPTEASFMGWLRSSFRQGFWSQHPVKMETLKTQRIRIKNPRPNPRKGAETVWGYQCNLCKGYFIRKDVEVDHKKGEFKLTQIEDLNSYLASLVFTTPEDLQIVCKQCHAIKTYAERYGVSENEAKANKKAIEVIKNNTYKKELIRLGVTKPVLKKNLREVLTNLYLQEIEDEV